MTGMNIGAAAKAAGLSAKMIRHYEAVGLLPAAARTHAGYRQYDETDVSTLGFIRRARDLGFAISEITELLDLWQNRKRASRVVKRLAEAHIQELEVKAQEILEMKASIEHLVHSCRGDERPECPILERLALGPTLPAPRASSRSMRLVSHPRRP